MSKKNSIPKRNSNRRGGVISCILGDCKRVGVKWMLYVLYPNQFSYVIWFRIFQFLYSNPVPFIVLKPFVKLFHEIFSQWMGIQIPLYAKIGKGLSIKHYSGIVINGFATIGECVTIFQNVTIGRSFFGKNKGVPRLGNNVVLFPGSIVIGNVTIGDNVIIGANAVVTTDIPSNSIVAGAPAKIVSNNVEEYFNNTYFTYYKKK